MNLEEKKRGGKDKTSAYQIGPQCTTIPEFMLFGERTKGLSRGQKTIYYRLTEFG
jgi:hypothetical protein